MPHNGPSINVEHALLKSRNFRRRPGEVPYPLEHVDASCSVFDIWNNMYRSRFENLTLHDFQTPPGMVLDLGCGTGYWAIEAAKKWKNSIVVGFDIKDVQPQLHYTRVLKHHHDIANRVKWVHGNLLDGLPFRSDHFDFVRVVNIGLGVPEDEWQFVFEEITRVMKPGGVIEPSTENEPEESDKNRTPDLRDHSRLKVAWNAMLASRFIAENALTVLPFYLSSTFVDVQSLPPVKVLLPPNSPFNSSERRAVLKRSSTESFFTATTFTSSRKAPPLSRTSSAWSAKSAAPSSLSRTSSGDSLDPYTTEFAQMHLANTVHTVLGCKEAIWQEYKKLYDFNVTKVVSPSAASPSGYTAHSTPRNLKSAIRESFDDEWESWHNDMTDRIGMRNLMSQLNWPEPPGQEPEWHVWRKKVQAIDDKKPNPIIPHNDTLDICRSMRGFIAFKPL
ncbi:hypothetical protein H0H92_005197 [Tricholoma furcatifolium]|nr:hypothetical protein H0H92_005197 [Tricholoma furcatifolium]